MADRKIADRKMADRKIKNGIGVPHFPVCHFPVSYFPVSYFPVSHFSVSQVSMAEHSWRNNYKYLRLETFSLRGPNNAIGATTNNAPTLSTIPNRISFAAAFGLRPIHLTAVLNFAAGRATTDSNATRLPGCLTGYCFQAR